MSSCCSILCCFTTIASTPIQRTVYRERSETRIENVSTAHYSATPPTPPARREMHREPMAAPTPQPVLAKSPQTSPEPASRVNHSVTLPTGMVISLTTTTTTQVAQTALPPRRIQSPPPLRKKAGRPATSMRGIKLDILPKTKKPSQAAQITLPSRVSSSGATVQSTSGSLPGAVPQPVYVKEDQ